MNLSIATYLFFVGYIASTDAVSVERLLHTTISDVASAPSSPSLRRGATETTTRGGANATSSSRRMLAGTLMTVPHFLSECQGNCISDDDCEV